MDAHNVQNTEHRDTGHDTNFDVNGGSKSWTNQFLLSTHLMGKEGVLQPAICSTWMRNDEPPDKVGPKESSNWAVCPCMADQNPSGVAVAWGTTTHGSALELLGDWGRRRGTVVSRHGGSKKGGHEGHWRANAGSQP